MIDSNQSVNDSKARGRRRRAAVAVRARAAGLPSAFLPLGSQTDRNERGPNTARVPLRRGAIRELLSSSERKRKEYVAMTWRTRAI